MASKSERLALLLQELRRDSSQRQLAKQLGITHSTIQSWESGAVWPGTKNFQKLAELKGWSYDRLYAFLEGDSVETVGVNGKTELTISEILSAVQSLSFEGAAKVVLVATERMLATRGESA